MKMKIKTPNKKNVKNKKKKKMTINKVIEVEEPQQKRFCDSKSFITDLVGYLKDMGKKRLVVDQNGLLTYMMNLGYTRSYVYLRIKAYQREVTKRIHFESQEGTFEPLVIEQSRYDFDGKMGLLYQLNKSWEEISIDKIKEVFEGVY